MLSPKKSDYLLWFEFLKRSPGFKKFCESETEKSEVLEYIRQMPDFEYYADMGRFSRLELVRLLCSRYRGYIQTLHLTKFEFLYLLYGDIFTNGFDTWYATMCRYRELLLSKHIKPVQEIGSQFAAMFDYHVRAFVKHNNREPTLHELRDLLASDLSQNNKVVLEITLKNGCTMPALVKECRALISPKYKTYLTSTKELDNAYLAERFFTPTEALYKKDLRKYLKVYDAVKSGNKTISQLSNYKGVGDEDKRRNYDLQYNKAYKILRNAELGTFPGKYREAPT